MLTSDPRIVQSTQTVNELTFEEATELAYFGAQVCRKGWCTGWAHMCMFPRAHVCAVVKGQGHCGSAAYAWVRPRLFGQPSAKAWMS